MDHFILVSSESAAGKKAGKLICLAAVFFCLLLCASSVFSAADEEIISITVHYSGTGPDEQTVTTDFSDAWLLAPDNQYNHKLMQASFVLAAAGFRDKGQTLDEMDDNIIDFFEQAGFTLPRTEDFNKETSADTIGTAIACKKLGDTVIIAVSVSGNNYQNEWLSNLTVGSEERANGFNTAAGKVQDRIRTYIQDNGLSGDLRLWISGYSRAGAVSNIAAADATDSGLFSNVYGYTIATPRTTKDEDAGKYDNIFNVINPFDAVPMVPFPEWGYVRYGTDLFLPSRETDSRYAEKKVRADEVCMESRGKALHYNPQINAELHTIMDYSLFYINSSNSYRDIYQTGILNVWKTKSPSMLIESILSNILALPNITEYQVNIFTGMLDYMLQITYSHFFTQVFHAGSSCWDRSISIKENVMHEHFDESYRSWIFSTDDPNELFMNDPRYVHYTVLGDVDIEFYDEDYNFIVGIDHNGKTVTDPRQSALPDSGKSPVDLFVIRQDRQTQAIIPMDQEFSARIVPHADQTVRSSYIEYTAGKLHADVKYILEENMKKGEPNIGLFSPEVVGILSEEDMLEGGFVQIEPWSQEVVYSPASVVQLENEGVFHPTVRFIFISGLLVLLMVIYFMVIGTVGTGSLVKKGVNKIRTDRELKKQEQLASEASTDDKGKTA